MMMCQAHLKFMTKVLKQVHNMLSVGKKCKSVLLFSFTRKYLELKKMIHGDTVSFLPTDCQSLPIENLVEQMA